MTKVNWESDIRVAVTFLVNGEPIAVPHHDFMLRFMVDGGTRKFDCTYKGGVYTNCKPNVEGTQVLCFINNHRLGIGQLQVKYYDYAPDSDFADGDMLTVTPSTLDIELIEGVGDVGTEITAEAIADVETIIADGQQVIDALPQIESIIAQAGDLITLNERVVANTEDIAELQGKMVQYDTRLADKQVKDFNVALDYDPMTTQYSISTAKKNAIKAALDEGRHVWVEVYYATGTYNQSSDFCEAYYFNGDFVCYGTKKLIVFHIYDDYFSLTDRFATVASSGNYNDLSDKPTIPTKTSDLTNDSTFEPHSVIQAMISEASQGKEDKGYFAVLPMTYNGSTYSYYVTPEMVTAINIAWANNRAIWLQVSLNGLEGFDTNNFDFVRVSKVEDGNENQYFGFGAVATIFFTCGAEPSENVSVNVGKTGTALGYAYGNDLAQVATSGSYADLNNKPTIPSKTSDLTNDSNFIDQSALNTALAAKADKNGNIAEAFAASEVSVGRSANVKWTIGQTDTPNLTFVSAQSGNTLKLIASKSGNIATESDVTTATASKANISGDASQSFSASQLGLGNSAPYNWTVQPDGASGLLFSAPYNTAAVRLPYASGTLALTSDITTALASYATTAYVDGLVGDINTALENIIGGN